MSTSRVLVLGGIRSGKSEFAEALLSASEQVSYLATGPVPEDDASWEKRVAAHRERRPADWSTEEFAADPYGLALRLSGATPQEALLVDDLGTWLTTVLELTGDWSDPAGADDAIDALTDGLRACRAGRVVLVSPEVGLSVVPATEAGRTFADALGRLNRGIAEAADRVTLVVAGQATWLKGERPEGGSRPAAPPVPLVGTAARSSTVERGEKRLDAHLDLPIPDETSSAAAVTHLAGLDFAGSGLGTLSAVVALAGGTQQRTVPRPWEDVRVLVLNGVHEGKAAAGDDPEVATRHLAQAHEGTGPLALLAVAAGATLSTVAGPLSGPMEDGDALTSEQVEEALATGWQLAESAVDEGADALVIASLGVGSEAAAVAVAALSAGGEPAALLDRVVSASGHVDDTAWMRRASAVRDALHRVRNRPRDTRGLLATVGGWDIAVATGIILGATFRRTPVVIDGPVGVAAGLAARDLGAQTRHWLILPDHGNNPLVRYGADVLGLTPVLHLKLRLGEGATALAALPLLRVALTLAAGTPETPPTPLTEDSPRWAVADFPTSELPIVKQS
jgi:nicotinate-nucleotide--dimethylbenzimidazole phosphoribosyltransferase